MARKLWYSEPYDVAGSTQPGHVVTNSRLGSLDLNAFAMTIIGDDVDGTDDPADFVVPTGYEATVQVWGQAITGAKLEYHTTENGGADALANYIEFRTPGIVVGGTEAIYDLVPGQYRLVLTIAPTATFTKWHIHVYPKA